MSLDLAVDHLLAAKRITGTKQSYAADNPAESLSVFSYLDGGPRPSGVKSELGLGLLALEDERRGSTPPPPPPPTEVLPFGEPVLTNPIRVTVPVTQSSYGCESGRDYIIDLERKTRETLTLSGSPRRVSIIGARFQVNDPVGGSGWGNRDGLNLNLLAEHVWITDYYVAPAPTMVDGLTIACKPTTIVTLQRALIEASDAVIEPTAHPDAIQIQGAIGRLEIGLATLFVAGVFPPNHAGKGIQLDVLSAVGQTGGPFSVDLRKVDFEGLGGVSSAAGISRSQMMIGKDDEAQIAIALSEVWGSAKPGAMRYGDGSEIDFPAWLVNYPSQLGAAVSGTKPNRRMTFTKPAQGWSGEFRERAPGTHFVTREMLGL